MRKIVIGDVHGCIDEFRELLKLVEFRQHRDFVLQVGDLMDRGPDPVACVRYAREIGAVVLMGNHEEKHVRWRKHEDRRAADLAAGVKQPKKNPMKPFNEERAAQNAALTDEEMDWMAHLPFTFDLGRDLIAVHAGFEPAYPVREQLDNKTVTRVRFVDDCGEMVGYSEGSLDQPEGTVFWTEAWAKKWDRIESVVYGHAIHSLEQPTITPTEHGACYGIDTGCVYGGKLTAMVINEKGKIEFAQVKAQQVYFDHYHPMGV
jgi:bis(5'-nucleosyl)-tetraphosphatase (symmetrical)